MYPKIVDDLPTTEDKLDFCGYVKTLHEIIVSPDTETPLTIGVYGEWGAGKTSLMRQLKACLKPGTDKCKCSEIRQQGKESYWTVWFDAWKYGERVTLWRALLLKVLSTLREKVEALQDECQKKPKSKACKDEQQIGKDKQHIDDLMQALYRPVEREEAGQIAVNWKSLSQGLLDIALSAVPPVHNAHKIIENIFAEMGKNAAKNSPQDTLDKVLDAFHRESVRIFVEHIQFLEQFQEKFKEALEKDYLQRLVVFIDDLDRCLPEQIIEVLEALKLFLDAEKCVFVLALDDELVRQAVEAHYRRFFSQGVGVVGEEEQDARVKEESNRYLEKVIQLPFHLPPIDSKKMEEFIRSFLANDNAESVDDVDVNGVVEVFREGFGSNPRQVKRAVNAFALLSRLARVKNLSVDPVLLAKIIVIQAKMRDLYEFLRNGNYTYIRQLEEYAEQQNQNQTVEKGKDVKVKIEKLPEALSRYWKGPGVKAVSKVLALGKEREKGKKKKFEPLNDDELKRYFTLTQHSVLLSDVEKRTETEKGNERVYFPEMVTVQDGEEVYEISKYPITNEQYQFFIQDTGYSPPVSWDGEAYPEGKGWHPVVGVSAKDAVAYCQWLEQKVKESTGERFHYTLPTREQWQQAARGKEEGCYPWGKKFDKNKCNTSERWEKGEGKPTTTPVGKYSPHGDSRYGCADMIGNVWEWTCTRDSGETWQAEGEGEEARLILCGGSFASQGKKLCIQEEGCRKGEGPLTVSASARFKDLGFRVVRLPKRNG